MAERRWLGLDDFWSIAKEERLSSFSLKQYHVSKQNALIVSVCEAVWHAHKTDFEERVLKLNRPWGRPYFSREKGDVDQPALIEGANVYVHTKLSADATRKLLRKLLEAFGYKVQDFALKVEEIEAEEVDLNSSGTV